MPLIYVSKYSTLTKFGNGNDRNLQIVIAVVSSILFGSLIHLKVENKYRNKSKIHQTQTKNAKIVFLAGFMLPVVLLVVIDLGSRNAFWGLDRKVLKPTYAGDLNYKCTRTPEINLNCKFGQKLTTKTVLLVGDSHADQISQAVIDAARYQGWAAQIWTYCRIQQERSANDYVTDECLKHNNQLFNWISLNKPDLIIVSQYVHKNDNLINFKLALKKILLVSSNVLLVENNPVFPDKSDYMIGRPILANVYAPPKQFSKDMMDLTDEKTSEQLANWARNNGILTLNFNRLFCNHSFCSRYFEGKWLYYDSNHFSIDGAKLTIPLIQEFMP
jgi:hypothetical protein